MKIKKYVFASIILFGVLLFFSAVIFEMRQYSQRNYNYTLTLNLITLIYIIVGTILGFEKYLTEFKKHGKWTVKEIYNPMKSDD